MAWTTAPSPLHLPQRRGWSVAPTAPPLSEERGWWAVIGLDDALTVEFVTETELIALKQLDLVRAVTTTRDLAFQAIYAMTFDRQVTVDRSLGLQGIYRADLALAETVSRALTISRITEVDLGQLLTAELALGLEKIRTVDSARSLTVNRSLGLGIAYTESFSRSITMNRELTMGKIAMLAGARSITANRTLGLGFPPNGPTSVTFTTVGSYTYTIPRWANFIDYVLLGGGGGGSSGNIAVDPGEGGDGGKWTYGTLTRGVDIPWNATQITGTVPDGGRGGAGGWIPSNGNKGGTATAMANVGGWSASAEGGDGGNFTLWQGGRAGGAPNPQTLSYNGVNYIGGAPTGNSAANGNPPGGGGGGGNAGAALIPAGAGGNGARGQVWFRAYQ